MNGVLPDRIHAKIMPVVDGCWLWSGVVNKDGYGLIKHEGRTQIAHRVVYKMLAGPIPDGLQIDHLCRVRSCVNPAHLEPVTAKENIRRGEGISGKNARKTHCKRGHPLSGKNLGINRQPNRPDSRRCKQCDREWIAAKKAGKRFDV